LFVSAEQSVFEQRFLNTVRQWFIEHHDVFVVARYSHMAGGREYFWFSDFAVWAECLKRFPPQTDLIVFRDNQFPVRGIVDERLILRALALIPDNTEAMVTDQLEPPNDRISVWACDTHRELIEALHDFAGNPAAIGLYAPWHEPDNDRMISALVPLPDGTLKRGVY
jgi:hypothetical protein